MASRVLLRHLVRASCRFQKKEAMRSLAPVSHAIQGQTQLQGQMRLMPERYSQIRSLCSQKGKGMVVNIQDKEDFEKTVINSDKPVVVDFHASWCGPCKLLGPRLESLVGAKKGQVILAKVDVDDHEELVMKYGISSVPTVIGFRNKEKVGQFIGLKDDDIIETFLDKLIG